MDRFNLFQYFILFAAFINHAAGQFQPYSPQLEWELRQALFSSYESEQRPEFTIQVSASLRLLSLNYLTQVRKKRIDIQCAVLGYKRTSLVNHRIFLFQDLIEYTVYEVIRPPPLIHVGKLAVTCGEQTWTDERLNWDGNLTYITIRFLYGTEKTVWRPPILLENSVENVDVISRPNVPMRITSSSHIHWTPAGIFTTNCESKVTYWPLDTQVCDIVISSWAYTSNEINLQFVEDEEAVVTTGYQEHGEWELVGKSNKSESTTRENEPFDRLIFTLKFRRRPLFHILNTLFPVVLMGFLTVTIFKLSPESGERVGLALTILLAYAVYLSLISDSIPQTSLSASLLSTYLATILLLQTIAVLLTVIYLDIYFTPDDKPVPNYLRSIASFIEALTTMNYCKKNSKIADSSQQRNDDVDKVSVYELAHFDGKTITDEKFRDEADVRKAEKKDEPTKKEYTWKEAALLLDRITLYIYLVVVTVLTIAFVSVMVDHYNSSYTSLQ